MARRLYEVEQELPFQLVADPEAEPLLQTLRRQGYRLAVVSNYTGTLLDDLRALGLAGYFDVILDSQVVGSYKPDPELFRIACAATGAKPVEAVQVGDSPDADVAGALAAGVHPILLDALDAFTECFPGLPEAPHIQRLAELPDLLKDPSAIKCCNTRFGGGQIGCVQCPAVPPGGV
ncbi:MAG: HAD family hydrolase [Symbiobacteriia bacterium]